MTITIQPDVVAQWAEEILTLKEQEETAKHRRAALESQLAACISTKEEGTEHYQTNGFKITVGNKLTRTLDFAAYQTLAQAIPDGLRPVRMKPELDLKKLRAMDMARPGFSGQFITTKPAKPSVKIEREEV